MPMLDESCLKVMVSISSISCAMSDISQRHYQLREDYGSGMEKGITFKLSPVFCPKFPTESQN